GECTAVDYDSKVSATCRYQKSGFSTLLFDSLPLISIYLILQWEGSKLLKLLYKQSIQIKNCRDGSAKKVLETAQKVIRKHGDEYLGYVIWFDRDTYDISRDANLFNSLNSQDNVEIYISNPCVENWLLAHFQEINIHESQCDRCLKILKQKYIFLYEKNDCNMLTKFITEEKIKLAAKNYPDLQQIPLIVAKNQLIKRNY
ncbi:MAG: RloB domain-containing protein, partial [Cyanobacteria bacterium P01_G01_bin.67]